jgi:hypothetical protein
MDELALDALLARTQEARREVADAVREFWEVQTQSRALLEWWERFRLGPSPLEPPPLPR